MNINLLKLTLQTGEVIEGTLRLSPMPTPTELHSVSRMSMSCSESRESVQTLFRQLSLIMLCSAEIQRPDNITHKITDNT